MLHYGLTSGPNKNNVVKIIQKYGLASSPNKNNKDKSSQIENNFVANDVTTR